MKDKSVLLVDDTSDTGSTLREAKETLTSILGANVVAIAVISKRKDLPQRQQQIDIDFFIDGAEHSGDYKDIEFPWSVKL